MKEEPHNNRPMKWTVLTDNRSKDPSFKTEHGKRLRDYALQVQVKSL